MVQDVLSQFLQMEQFLLDHSNSENCKVDNQAMTTPTQDYQVIQISIFQSPISFPKLSTTLCVK